MWQRFSEHARQAVFHAQEEAQRLGDGYVSTEHLLLGLLRNGDSTAMRALSAIGVSAQEIWAKVERQLPKGESRPGADMTLTPRAKQVIDLAYEEARNMSHNYIGTEHLLLGLLREGDGLAGRVLAGSGVGLDALRLAVMEVAPPNTERLPAKTEGWVARFRERMGFPRAADAALGNDAIPERCTERARAIVVRAREDALARGAAGVGAEHLVLALLGDPECRGTRALARLGGDLERAQRAAEGLAAGEPAAEVPDPMPLSPSGQRAIVGAYTVSAGMGNPFVGTEHLALALFGGAFGESVDPVAFASDRVHAAVARSQAEE